jgi:hypothetical protein
MPQAKRKPAQARGWRYSHGLTKNLMSKDRGTPGVPEEPVGGVKLSPRVGTGGRDPCSVTGTALLPLFTKLSASVP